MCWSLPASLPLTMLRIALITTPAPYAGMRFVRGLEDLASSGVLVPAYVAMPSHPSNPIMCTTRSKLDIHPRKR